MSKRKETEKFLLDEISGISTSSKGSKILRDFFTDFFKSLNDKEFDNYMKDLKSGKTTLSIIVPNNGDIKVETDNNIKRAKKLGFDFFQHITVPNQQGMPPYTTPQKMMLLMLPIKRPVQLLSKGIAIPEDDKSIDLTTGQVTGKSRATKITYPEVQILAGLGLKKSVKELMKHRGGDLGATNAMNNILYRQGSVDANTIEQYSTGVESLETLKSYWLASHIKSTL